MSKGQEGSQTQEHINEFIRIADEKILRSYEEKNRDRIIDAPAEVRFSFDEVWRKITGKPYFQPVTSLRTSKVLTGRNDTEAGDPKSCKYREARPFTNISWIRRRQKIGKRMRPSYTFHGDDAETGTSRQLYANLSEERVRNIFGTEISRKVFEDKNNEGTLREDVDLSVEGFWQVLFTPKQDPNDTRDVELLWEGQVLLIERMKPVVLPGFYIEVADNATKAQYIQTPEESRKIISYVQKYPYTVQRRATIEEYIKMKTEGDRITREAHRRREEAI